MQRKLDKRLRSDDEIIKEAGLTLDFDEIARKGSMTREEIAIAKWYGIYHSKQKGNHMARVVVPGGKLTSVEARGLAELARTYAPDRLSITTRQSIQFHCLDMKTLAAFMRDLAGREMTTFHGCGDVCRNVAACPWAPVCPHRRFDVQPYAEETAALIAASRDLDNLPRKFKITFSGCEGGCGQPHINCVGLIGVARKTADGGLEEGFRVLLGGGLGWKPFIGQELYSFVPKDKAPALCRAAGILFRDTGDRHIRMYARLKWVVYRQGIEACRQRIGAILDQEGVDSSGFMTEPVEDQGPAVPDRPLREPEPVGDGGLGIERIMIPKGEIAADAVARIADLAEIYGDKHVYATNRQNVELHGVDPARREELRHEIGALGLAAEGFFGLQDVVTCVGTKYCPLAVTMTHDLFDALQPIVHDEKYAPIRGKVLINISGCPNSCGQFHIADIGLRGMRIREMQGSVESYLVTLGGTEEQFGEKLGEYKFADTVRVVRTILDTFLAADTDQTLAAHVRAAGMDVYRKAVAALGIAYEMAVNPLELSVDTGMGLHAKDLTAVAKDIPCQEACPAKTDVPGYIGHIAHEDPVSAHLINQEDNVLPGILGRVCTRPCQDRCRYQWTSTRGPVQICHLKRTAADAKPGKSQPLPKWFDATGKRVAVVGAGPAGMAAARELDRYGHKVTVFERGAAAGGQVLAIPPFRLPKAIIDEDFAAILEAGIDVRTGEAVDAGMLDALTDEYDAVLIATGANKPREVTLEGLEPGMAQDGLAFMMDYSGGRPVSAGSEVVVVGGGFTAVDCARSARRLAGADARVSIMYRRGEAQMAANAEELHELRREGVRIETLVTPLSVQSEDGAVKSVRFLRNILGEPDGSGKPRFIPIEGYILEVPCDTLIMAIGQTQELEILGGAIEVADDARATNRPGVFVAGDFASGSGDIIHSVADGKAAAETVDTYLMGERRRWPALRVEEAGLTGRTRDHDLVYPPGMPVLPLAERDRDGEVEQGYLAAQSAEHAWRCYLCNHKFEIDQDKCIHCDWCIRVSPRECIRRLRSLELDSDGVPVSWEEVSAAEPAEATYIWIDSDNCIRCGNCINICPTGAITLRRTDRVTIACGGDCAG